MMDGNSMGARIVEDRLVRLQEAMAGITAAGVHEIRALHYENTTKNFTPASRSPVSCVDV